VDNYPQPVIQSEPAEIYHSVVSVKKDKLN
jgi:hypothetical protein